MDELARQFLNQYQGGFPIEEQPYASVAASLGTDPATLIETIRKMIDTGTLSRFGPLYDVSSMGGRLTLAAMSVPEDRFDEVAELGRGFAPAPFLLQDPSRTHVRVVGER